MVAVTGQLADEQRAAAVASGSRTPVPHSRRRCCPDAHATDPRGRCGAGCTLPAAATALPLELRVPPAARATPPPQSPSTNGIVWRSPPSPLSEAAFVVVPVRIPASLLKAQHYALDLFEVRAGTPSSSAAMPSKSRGRDAPRLLIQTAPWGLTALLLFGRWTIRSSSRRSSRRVHRAKGLPAAGRSASERSPPATIHRRRTARNRHRGVRYGRGGEPAHRFPGRGPIREIERIELVADAAGTYVLG